MKRITVVKKNNIDIPSEVEETFKKNGFLLNYKINKSTELILSLGGDGTILKSVQLIKDFNIPILGLNFGRLGFLTSDFKHDLEIVILQLKNDNYRLENRCLLNISAYNKKQLLFEEIALNEVVIRSEHIYKLTELEVSLDNILVSKYIADGVIIATPTGSTAYSLSSGGPILEPDMKAFILTPICPHSLNQRPLIFNNNKKATVKTLRKDNLFVSIDGHLNHNITHTAYINIKKAKYSIKIVRFPNENFYEILREKLSWGNK